MKFECFYYPTLNENHEVIKINENLREFNFGDTVPTKTLYYNYGKSFAIYQGSEFFVVDDGVLTKTITANELKFPLKIVFAKGTQLKIFSAKDLSSIRLLLKGESEKEKELGELFFLCFVLNRKIKDTQYKIMSDLTNSSRDFTYINDEIDLRTKKLLNDLKILERKFYNLTIENPNLKDSYLNYMNFSNKENMLELSINKYFKEGTEEHNHYILTSSVWKSKPIYPKFKLDNLINSYNYRD
ncbi:hypothetical protein [Romboutsia sp.]|uniref:hypothetical protein n=1 Tax=Romboutsia sp. TaxID=1965302 RepID=UPI002C09C297|nr:hypothetical protein [Romboutsia sp.]HSQ90426.1 hypothetical protein [Romboutsia sp.]